ncbi:MULTISPECIES: helix-turn-helix transcriptional regulator [unclassified Streptomyces]|uniref:helix-turn-helix transcriptional regulator n=1 Tax=unclassified Streptomyces TaxID=2593676 RepID=UPI001660D1D4|nr:MULTISPECIES: LuxR C-terminal-related transcriptional regulator [unclassified Streptomyces]MBD0707374.1 hypothetical protein [Streptomyces sp. CBMA291]MBD0715174.1 hypothetical protein [Streptomyces sp. CBMA370]
MTAPGSPDIEAAAVIAATATTLLGARLSPADAEQLGNAALAALRADGWSVQVDLGRVRAAPLLWSCDLPVLAGLARGRAVAEIAAATQTPTATVRGRILRLRARIGAPNAAAAVAIAYRHGWMAGLAPEPRRPIVLSSRERQALALLADGLGNAALAQALGMSPAQATECLRRLYTALNVTTSTRAPVRAHAVALGFQHGLLPLPATRSPQDPTP